MKRILHVIYGMNAGGMETMIMNYYRNIDKTKFQFDFLINEKNKVFYEDEINKLGGKIYRSTLPKKNILKNRKEINNILKEKHYDVIHVHQGITYFYPIKAAYKYGIKNRIVHNHGINRYFLKYLYIYNNLFAKKRICHYANNFISCSKNVLNHLFTNKIINNEIYSILPNAIEIERYKYNDSYRKKIRKELNISNEEKVFIHIGTFTMPKNHKFIIEMFNEYLKNNDAKLLLIGNGPLKSNIEELCNKLNINKKVLFLGIRNDIEKLLSASDVMIFPSIYEGLPLTLVEAQANGIKILASSNISDETKLTDLIKYLDIDNFNLWINELKKNNFNNKNRIKYNSFLSKSDYNIKVAVKNLEKIYNKF